MVKRLENLDAWTLIGTTGGELDVFCLGFYMLSCLSLIMLLPRELTTRSLGEPGGVLPLSWSVMLLYLKFHGLVILRVLFAFSYSWSNHDTTVNGQWPLTFAFPIQFLWAVEVFSLVMLLGAFFWTGRGPLAVGQALCTSMKCCGLQRCGQ